MDQLRFIQITSATFDSGVISPFAALGPDDSEIILLAVNLVVHPGAPGQSPGQQRLAGMIAQAIGTSAASSDAGAVQALDAKQFGGKRTS